MPIYEYECTQCSNRFEVKQRLSDDPLETCNTCSGKLIRIISPPAIHFKGTGWYVTDYATKSGNKKDGGNKENTTSDSSTAQTCKDKSACGTNS